MLSRNETYNNSLISSWFITLLLLLGIGGYSNYTPPVSYQETIELVISDEESCAKTLSFTDVLPTKQHFDPYNTYLKLISEQHSTICLLKTKEFDNSIPLTIFHKTSFFRNYDYSSEEESFHLV